MAQNTIRKAVVRRGKLPTLDDLSDFYERVVQFEKSGPHHDLQEDRYKGSSKYRDSAPIIGETPLEIPAENCDQGPGPHSQVEYGFSRSLELSDDSHEGAVACEDAMTQDPTMNVNKERNRLEATDAEDEDNDNVSGAELCDEAPRLRLVQQSQNDNDDEIVVDNSQRREEMEEYWNLEGMTESRFNTPKANPGPEKRRRSEPAHSLGFQDEEEEMRKIARQNASESRGLDHQIKGKSMLISMAETVARVGKSTVGSLMMKVTSGIPWSGQKPKESREVGQNEEESIQPKSLFPDHEARRYGQEDQSGLLEMEARELDKTAAAAAAAAVACEEETGRPGGDDCEKTFPNRAGNEPKQRKGGRRAASSTQGIGNLAKEPAVLSMKQSPDTRGRQNRNVERSVNSKQKSRIRDFSERENMDQYTNLTRRVQYAAHSTSSRVQSQMESTKRTGEYLGGLYEKLGQNRVNLERKRRALIQNLD